MDLSPVSEQELQDLVKKLGCGGWRMEHGIMPLIVLTGPEARSVVERIEKAEQAHRDLLFG